MTPALQLLLIMMALTVAAFVFRRPVGALLAGVILLGQFLAYWLRAAMAIAFAAYCLSGDSAMAITRIAGGIALLMGLYSLARSIGLFGPPSPEMEDTTLGARFATRDELRRAGLLRRSLDDPNH